MAPRSPTRGGVRQTISHILGAPRSYSVGDGANLSLAGSGILDSVQKRRTTDEPFGLPADDREFEFASSNVMGQANIAYGPFSIDAEDESDFQHRWLTLFARAATGELNRPSRMPVPPGFFAE